MRKVYDISMTIFEGMPVYKNKPEKQPQFEVTSDHASAHVRETRIHLDVHTGTHVDAPLHMVEGGATTETVTLEKLVCDCKVLDLMHVTGSITRDALEGKDIQAGDFVLFKTKNSLDQAFNPDFIFLAEDGAQYLAQLGISGVGIDALGVERSQPGHPTHKALFGRDIVIIEGLRLADVAPGEYFMVAAPLRLIGLDASPARVILISQ